MELLSFIVALGLGLILTYYSIRAKSFVFGILAGIFFIVIGVSILYGGLTEEILTIVVQNSTVSNTYTTKTLFDDGVFTPTILGYLFIGVAVFVLFSNALEIYERNKL
jgi:hypothetical protein